MQEQIRFVTFNDIPRILEIYTPYITDTTISFEYEPPSLEEFTARVQTTSSKYPYLVYERDSVILGFAYGSPYQERIAYNFDADLSVYLAPEAQKGGIGRKLYTCLLDLLQKQGFYNVYACITATNQRSIDFHKSLGFRDLGAHPRAGYKFDQWLDIVWMDKQLPQASDLPQPHKPITAFNNDDILKLF